MRPIIMVSQIVLVAVLVCHGVLILGRFMADGQRQQFEAEIAQEAERNISESERIRGLR